MEHQTEVLVIGGGAVGVCSAYYLWKAGKQVTLIDRGNMASGSSYGNAGLIVPSHLAPLNAPGAVRKGMKWLFDPEGPFSIKMPPSPELMMWMLKFSQACRPSRLKGSMQTLANLSQYSVPAYQEFNALELDFDFQDQGVLLLAKSEEGHLMNQKMTEVTEPYGFAGESLSQEQLHDLDPQLNTTLPKAVYYGCDGSLNPSKFVQSMADHLEKQGVVLRKNDPVQSLVVEQGRVKEVQTSEGRIQAETVVMAGGAETPRLLKPLGLKVPIQPAKGYSVTYEMPNPGLKLPMMLTESKVILTPMGSTLRVAGMLEFSGYDTPIQPQRIAGMLKTVPEYLKGVDVSQFEQKEVWQGLRPCTPDGLPIIERNERYSNLVLAAGHSMMGMTLAPGTGMAISDLVTQKSPRIPLDGLRLKRF